MNLVNAMEYWQGRVDSETDYEAFRWHQKVEPIDLNTAEPFTGKLGFVFIGFCSDLGVSRNRGRSGAALGPDFIRKQMATLPCNFQQEVKMYDAGDVDCTEITLEAGQQRLSEAVKKALDLGLFPIVLGGGHETTFGHYMGHHDYRAEQYGVPDMGIINFDAHFDIRPYDKGASSGSMFRQIADICEKENRPFRYLPVGIQLHSNTVSLFHTAEKLGVQYILAKELQEGGQMEAIAKMDHFLFENKNLYVTVCTDVFSSAFAPGVSAPQALGLDPKEMLPLLKHTIRTRKVKGFDICEVAPRFDSDNTTAKLAAVLIFAVVETMAECEGLLFF